MRHSRYWFRAPLVFGALAFLLVAAVACGDDDDAIDDVGTDPGDEILEPTGDAEVPVPYPFDDPAVTDSGLEYVDVIEGEGDPAEPGNRVTAHYTGTFLDGEIFDTSEGREPFTFTLGMDNVIQGWHEGVVGMRIGGTRHLYLPPELAYGDQGFGPIPPDTPLLFEIQLLGIE